jgi:NAD(P)-dependent dehydrogenase (short-subunit alcohol dehydrogenase family)
VTSDERPTPIGFATALRLADDESVRRAFDDVGDLAVLVNNAAITAFGSAEETDLGCWRELFETNLFGAVRCMQAALPVFRARGGGCIINVSSAAGAVALPAVSAYAASKAALESASEAAAIEGREHQIRVEVIHTGATATATGTKAQPPSRQSPYWALSATP